MRRLVVVLLVLAVVPGWSGLDRLARIRPDASVTATPLALPRQVEALTPVGAIGLQSDDAAFGGISAIAAADGRLTLLDDGANWTAFALRGGRPTDVRSGALREGPGTGWLKEDRDSEALVRDPATGRWWIGFERANAIWRYTPDFAWAEAAAAPRATARWRANSGAEAMVRLADGRFLVLAETGLRGTPVRRALLFPGDPTRTRPVPLGYQPPPGMAPSDAALLPSGDVIVLNRRFSFPWRFATVATIIPRAADRHADRGIARRECGGDRGDARAWRDDAVDRHR